MFKKIYIFFLVVILICSCKKYEDDPASSRLLSVKIRMCAHSWEHASVSNYKTGQVYSTSRPSYTKFSRIGGCSSRAYFLSGCDTWTFVDHKNQIAITYGSGEKTNFKITTLTWESFELENDSIKIELTRK